MRHHDRVAEVLRQIDEFMARPDFSEWHIRGFLEQLKKQLGQLYKDLRQS